MSGSWHGIARRPVHDRLVKTPRQPVLVNGSTRTAHRQRAVSAQGFKVETTIFINYRSCDEPFAALFIDKRLAERFGAEQVFRDTRTIRPGTHFPTEILQALRQCRVLLAVIGQRWFRRGPDGRRLIDDPTDYVRLEIAHALGRNDVVVVPVLVGDTPMPAAYDLPADIAGLASRQYIRLRVRDAEYDASRLVDELVELLGEAGL